MSGSDSKPSATYSDGKTTRRNAVALELTDDRLVIRAQDGRDLAQWKLRDIRAVPGQGAQGTLRLALKGTMERLTLTDPHWIAKLRAACKTLNTGDTDQRRLAVFIAGLTLTSLVSIVALFVVALPAMSEFLARLIPAEWEQEVGSQLAELILKDVQRGPDYIFDDKPEGTDKEDPTLRRGKVCQSPDGLAALATLVRPIEREAGAHVPLVVRVIDDPMINAWTLPGGQIFIFRGLIEAADNPDEVAGVIAHEVGHVLHRDPSSLMIETMARSYLLGLILGDVSGGFAIVTTLDTLIASRNSREVEERADTEAMRILKAAGISLRPLSLFFDKLTRVQGEAEKTLWLLSSHPLSEERAARLRDAPQTETSGPVLTLQQWKQLRAICEEEEAGTPQNRSQAPTPQAAPTQESTKRADKLH